MLRSVIWLSGWGRGTIGRPRELSNGANVARSGLVFGSAFLRPDMQQDGLWVQRAKDARRDDLPLARPPFSFNAQEMAALHQRRVERDLIAVEDLMARTF
ncbi:hypothetical protein WDB88_17385 (plasmid) [Thioclava sp. GXIMD4216]